MKIREYWIGHKKWSAYPNNYAAQIACDVEPETEKDDYGDKWVHVREIIEPGPEPVSKDEK